MKSEKKRCIMCGNEILKSYNARFCDFVKERMFKNKNCDTELVYCPNCGLYYSSRRPDDKESDGYYKNYMEEEYINQRCKFEPDFSKYRQNYINSGDSEKEFSSRIHSMKSMFKKYIDFDKIKSVLDYGGARGNYILKEFKNAQKFLYDLDVLEPANENTIKISYEELINHKFDFIQCCHVLEHVAYPMEIIKKLISLMKAGSYLFIEVPYENDLVLPPPPRKINNYKKPIYIHEHISFFNPEVFEKCFSSSEFIILENKVVENSYLFGPNKSVQCLVKMVEPSDSVIYINSLRHLIKDCQKEFNDRLNIIEHNTKTTLLEKVFSVKQEGRFIIIRFFGLNIKIKK